MRYLSAINAVDEPFGGHYSPNQVTKNLTEKVTEAGLGHL